MFGQEVRWNQLGWKRQILAFTDLHFSERLLGRRLDLVLKRLRQVCAEERIDYIFFLGDLINSVTVLSDQNLRVELEKFLNSLAEQAPVCLVTGNHDVCDYTAGMCRGEVRSAEWDHWLEAYTERNPRIIALDENNIYDDGVVRVLGLRLPEGCYEPSARVQTPAIELYRQYAEKVLPKLTAVTGREYYLLMHTPQFLTQVEIDPCVTVLAGHMHNGLVPPVLDELTRFSQRGLVGPGYRTKRGRKVQFFPLAAGARYWPKPGRPWLTVNSVVHLPPESWLWHFDGCFPAVSYVIMTSDEPEVGIFSRYFRMRGWKRRYDA